MPRSQTMILSALLVPMNAVALDIPTRGLIRDLGLIDTTVPLLGPAGEAADPVSVALVVALREKTDLTREQALEIGRLIWRNESGSSVEKLAWWNEGETFASMGIGHFIWYSAGRQERFDETFPRLLAYMKERGARLPAWLGPDTPCPWRDRASFVKGSQSPRMKELRSLLASTVELQARFIIQRLRESVPEIQAAAPGSRRAHILRQFNRVADSGPTGLYALADYVNFKGKGISPKERYSGQGWGLLQVLDGMSGGAAGQTALDEFAESAERALRRRVQNSPPERNESRWLNGWLKRVQTYRG